MRQMIVNILILIACTACSNHPEGDATFVEACKAESGWRVYHAEGVDVAELGVPSTAIYETDENGGLRLQMPFPDTDTGVETFLLTDGAKAVVTPFYFKGPFFDVDATAREKGVPGLYRVTVEKPGNPNCQLYDTAMQRMGPPNLPDIDHCVAVERIGPSNMMDQVDVMFVRLADYSSASDRKLEIIRRRTGLWSRTKGWIVAENTLSMAGFYGDATSKGCYPYGPRVENVSREMLKYIHWK